MKKMKYEESQTQGATELASLIRAILSEIVLHGEELEVVPEVCGPAVNIRINPHPGDAKRIIGSRGAHFHALKLIVRFFGERRGFPADLKHLNAPMNKRDRYEPFQPRSDWPKERLVGLIERIAEEVFEEPATVECFDHAEDSTIVVTLHAFEKPQRVAVMRDVLDVLGKAIGPKNGRALSVQIAKETLPHATDGRYAKTVATGAGKR